MTNIVRYSVYNIHNIINYILYIIYLYTLYSLSQNTLQIYFKLSRQTDKKVWLFCVVTCYKTYYKDRILMMILFYSRGSSKSVDQVGLNIIYYLCPIYYRIKIYTWRDFELNL